MSTVRKCYACKQEKPLDAFPLKGAGQRSYECKACKAAQQREKRSHMTQDERNAEMAAYRAGIRKATCAVCGGAETEPLCTGCRTAIRALGGTEAALKRAAKVVHYLGEV